MPVHHGRRSCEHAFVSAEPPSPRRPDCSTARRAARRPLGSGGRDRPAGCGARGHYEAQLAASPADGTGGARPVPQAAVAVPDGGLPDASNRVPDLRLTAPVVERSRLRGVWTCSGWRLRALRGDCRVWPAGVREEIGLPITSGVAARVPAKGGERCRKAGRAAARPPDGELSSSTRCRSAALGRGPIPRRAARGRVRTVGQVAELTEVCWWR